MSSKHHVQKKPPPSNAKILVKPDETVLVRLPIRKEKKKSLRDILLNKDLFVGNLNPRRAATSQI